MQKNVRLRLLSNFVILFSLIAIAWWSILLFTLNRDAFQGKAGENKMLMIADGKIKTDAEYLETQFYKDLKADYERQEWMIVGESLVFILSIIIGVYLINRGYNKEIAAAQQRRNFLLSITHELKSPIASIKLVLETFIKRELSPKHINQLSNNAVKETDRLNELVNDLLLAAKVETSYTPNLEEINVTQFLADIIQRLQSKYATVAFDFRKPKDPVNIYADRTGLTSVAVNLLENAVKYGTTNTKISTVLRQNEQQEVFIEIADNGIGIANKEKKKVFDRFYRVGNEDTRKTKGTGLGLYIVRQIVLAHNGKVSVADNKPQGTIFTISLPSNDV